MLRIFAFSSVVLLYLAATQCVAVEKEASFCDEESCDADCRKTFALPGKRAFGKCEGNGFCKCYRNLLCNESTCEKLCRERLAQESGIHSNCTVDQCYCSWDKKCVESECSEMCRQSYPDADVRESRCNGTQCICESQGGSARRRTNGQDTEASVAKQAVELQQRVFHVFALGDEEVEPRGETQRRKLVHSASGGTGMP